MLFKLLVEMFEQVSSTSKRLEKTFILSEFIKNVSESELSRVILLSQGLIFPPWDPRKIGFSAKLIIKSIAQVAGIPEKKVIDKWKRLGDLGETTEALLSKKGQSSLVSRQLSVKEVFNSLRKLASLKGEGSTGVKIRFVAGLLNNADPNEARYIVRFVLEDLRVGIAEGTIRDAIVWAFSRAVTYDKEKNNIDIIDKKKYDDFSKHVQSAFNKCNDFSVVAEAAKKGINAIKSIKLKIFTPIRVMLAQKELSIASAFDRVGRPAALEYKYDGFRLCIHKSKDKIMLFTRRLEDVTKQFPDVVDAVKRYVHTDRCILDSETVGLSSKSGTYLPFQAISQRIRRKYDINKMSKEFPVEVNVFDIMFFDGKSVLDMPFRQRRKIIEKIIKEQPKVIKLSNIKITDSEADAERFFKEALKAGTEGLMFKNLEGLYNPGSRVGHMVKYKVAMNTFDVVIIGAEWGTGKRSGWLTSFKIAVLGHDKDILSIGKVGTGIKELEESGFSFSQLTELLKPLIVEEHGREVVVKPKIVIEVAFEEIQKSTNYDSGYALRFPRVVRYRPDRGVMDITLIGEVDSAFKGQVKRR